AAGRKRARGQDSVDVAEGSFEGLPAETADAGFERNPRQGSDYSHEQLIAANAEMRAQTGRAFCLSSMPSVSFVVKDLVNHKGHREMRVYSGMPIRFIKSLYRGSE